MTMKIYERLTSFHRRPAGFTALSLVLTVVVVGVLVGAGIAVATRHKAPVKKAAPAPSAASVSGITNLLTSQASNEADTAGSNDSSRQQLVVNDNDALQSMGDAYDPSNI